MALPDPRPSRYQQVSAAAQSMLAAGESGRFEFKRDAEAVKPSTLATLANWVALSNDVDVAHILVGVDEVTDEVTGLVSGHVRGLPNGLERAVARLNDLASTIMPVPVDAFVIEEGVETATPFVRVEVRPTQPPHYDKEGRRQTRQGASTRAVTDDELLRIYLTREAGTFAARYRQISTELHSAVGNISAQVETLAGAIDSQIAQPLQELSETAESAAMSAHSAADAAGAIGSDVYAVETMVRDLRDVVEVLEKRTNVDQAVRIIRKRRIVWWTLNLDTWKRTSARAAKLVDDLRQMLEGDISVDEDHSTWELDVWDELLADRADVQTGRITLAWWSQWRTRLMEYFDAPAYRIETLPDLRSVLQSDDDGAIHDPDGAVARFRATLDE